jgi:uncharacterized protein YjbJ (UPF0337 family)
MTGTRDQFVGKVQERYGLAKEEAQRKADEWLTAQPWDTTGLHKV